MKQNLLFLLLILLFSCQPESDDPVFIVDVEDEFRISLKESLTTDESQRQLIVNLSTINPVTCSKASIHTEDEILENQFVINIKGIEKPEPCDNIMTLLEKDVPTKSLDNGIFNIQFILQEAIFNWGQIVVNDEGYSISMQSEFGIEIAYDQLSRIPKNVIWGYMSSQRENPDLFNILTTSLEKLGASSTSLRTGNYHYFKIYSGSSPDFDVVSPYDNHSRFIYEYDGSADALQALLDVIKDNHADGSATFKIYTSKGDVLE